MDTRPVRFWKSPRNDPGTPFGDNDPNGEPDVGADENLVGHLEVE